MSLTSRLAMAEPDLTSYGLACRKLVVPAAPLLTASNKTGDKQLHDVNISRSIVPVLCHALTQLAQNGRSTGTVSPFNVCVFCIEYIYAYVNGMCSNSHVLIDVTVCIWKRLRTRSLRSVHRHLSLYAIISKGIIFA